MATRIIIHTESLNSYGFWLRTAGMRLNRYTKNPVVLYEHEGRMMPVGRADISIEGSNVVADVTFDAKDELGKELERKYTEGFMFAASINFDPLTLSEDSIWLKQGQQRATILEWELVELSLVTLPSNADCVKLSRENQNAIPVLNPNTNFMKKIALAFGLQAEAPEEAILGKLNELNAKITEQSAKNTEAQSTINALNIQLEAQRSAQLEAALSNPKKTLSETQKENYRKLAKGDLDTTLQVINELPEKTSVREFLGQSSAATDDKLAGKTFLELTKEQPLALAKIKEDEPERFKELYMAQFGKAPVM